VRIGVASSSKNCGLILEKSGVRELFESRVDGVVSAELGLKGKPEGDIFVKAARDLDAEPSRSVVVEDAVSGVQAGRNGGFGLVIGVAREENEQDLLAHGADMAVYDLGDISVDCMEKWFERKPLSLFERWGANGKDDKQTMSCCEQCDDKVKINPSYLKTPQQIFGANKEIVFFLDYDGTLTPIMDRPDLAVVSEEMRSTVKALAHQFKIAIVSGRFREDVENLLKVKDIFYAGSHGLDIAGPGFHMIESRAQQAIPSADQLISSLKTLLSDIPGILIEEKKFSAAVHYRLVDEGKYLDRIMKVVFEQAEKHPMMRVMSGKKVFEILPDIDWDKGKAIRWIMDALKISWKQVAVVYIGDDVTDEYAFRAIRTRGTGILVSDESRVSSADFQLSSPDEVKKFFDKILKHV
jgi:trehalose-phosphatase